MFQKCCKWFSKYLKCIHARCEHFITHSQCSARKYEQSKRITSDADYEHIKTIGICRHEFEIPKVVKSLEIH